MRRIRFFVTMAVAVTISAMGCAQEIPRVLFLSKSAGFEHSSIRLRDGEEGHVQKVLIDLAMQNGAELTVTKDAGSINKENLKNYDLVIFYTTGDLTEEGDRGEGAMGENGVADLIEWIKGGGGFIGYHCATDTFHSKTDESTEYTKLIGGEFKSHGRQFAGTLRVVDPDHPAMVNVPQGWKMLDEWYMFKNLNAEGNMHVLALLDPAEERANQEMYNVPNYPVVWCMSVGAGRVLYNAMGHREDVWDDETFQQFVVDSASWAMGTGETDADPNYDEVVPEK